MKVTYRSINLEGEGGQAVKLDNYSRMIKVNANSDPQRLKGYLSKKTYRASLAVSVKGTTSPGRTDNGL